MLYGAKYIAIHKLKKIYELKNLIKQNSDPYLKVLLITLAYSLTGQCSRYKLSLKEKLISLNLDSVLLNVLPKLSYSENNISTCFLFILGLFLGDGTLHLKLLWKKKNNTIAIVPLFNIVQSNTESNKEIMEKLAKIFNNLNIKSNLIKSTKTFVLSVKGIDNVFNSLFPLLVKYSHFLY
jgi:hypothetical protein